MSADLTPMPADGGDIRTRYADFTVAGRYYCLFEVDVAPADAAVIRDTLGLSVYEVMAQAAAEEEGSADLPVHAALWWLARRAAEPNLTLDDVLRRPSRDLTRGAEE